MKQTILFFTLVLTFSINSFAQTTVFQNVNVIPMNSTSETVLMNQTVVVSEDRIIEIGENIEIPANATLIDGSGKYLIPGLAEMHGHLPPNNPSANAPSYFNQEYVESTLFLYVAAGVTTVRGMLGYSGQLELKSQVNNGELIGPNLYLAGPSFSGNTVSSPQQASEKVQQQFNEGWDLVKVHPGLSSEEFSVMRAKARELDFPFGGHVPQEVGIEMALSEAQISIDHIDGYYEYLSQFPEEEWGAELGKLIDKTIASGTWIVPTQALWETIIGAADYEKLQQFEEMKYIPKAVEDNYINFVNNRSNSGYFAGENARKQAEWRQKILGELHRKGANIVMGTDAPQIFSVPGFSIHRELPYMKGAGMSNYEILLTGSKYVGEYFKDKDTFGLIEAGHRADLILVNQNPLDDLENLKNHSGVMVSGKWYSEEMIDNRLKEIEEYYLRD